MKQYLVAVAAGCIITFQLHAQTLQSVTDNGNKTTNRVILGTKDDGFTKLQIAGGGLSLNSGLTNASARPGVANGNIPEIRAISNTDTYADDGFLRLGAGGGTNASTKSYIELSGFSQLADMSQNIVLGTRGTERMRIDFLGNVGIGTSNPETRLQVAGAAKIQGELISEVSNDVLGGRLTLVNPSKTASGIAKNWTIYNMTGNYSNSLQFWAYDNAGCSGGGMCVNRFTIMDNGNVGIGTSTPQSLLAVAGTITAKRLQVTQLGWPDFVFAPDYIKPSLPEVERYISQHRRLPGIPSEAEIVKEGLDVGEMQKQQMQKIEELTLYLIDQHKQITAQQQLIANQQQQLSALQERLKALENKTAR